MELARLPYELLGEIFKAYASLPDTLPETLLQVCSSWNAVASREPCLWTTFVVSCEMITRESNSSVSDWPGNQELTGDRVDVCKRRLARAGPSLPLQVYIMALHQLLLPVIDVISGGAPDYIHLPRWETLHLRTYHRIEVTEDYPSNWPSIGNLISQPMPSLKCLALRKIDIYFHAF